MNQKGFTLVEVKICCAILAIIAAVGYPHFESFKQSQPLREEVRVLCGNLQNAKIYAVKENSFVVFQIFPKGYVIYVDNGAGGGKNGDWVRQDGEKKLIERTFQKGVSLSSTTFTAYRTRFNGRANMKAGRVILKNSAGSSTQLVVNTVGRLRVEKS